MKRLKLTQAFTIIELTAVMVIIMILASLIMGVGRRARIAAMEAKAESMIAGLEIAISMYRTDTGEYPPTDAGSGCDDLYDYLTNTDYGDGLGTDDIEGWRGPYMEFKGKDLDDPDSPGYIKDPWGKAYNYETPGDNNIASFDLWSIGTDDENGTNDDIINW